MTAKTRRREEVELDLAFPVPVGDLEERFDLGDARVVHEHIRLRRRLDQSADVRGVGQVRGTPVRGLRGSATCRGS